MSPKLSVRKSTQEGMGCKGSHCRHYAYGAHSVALTFVEPSLHPGERIFDVLANGKKVVTDLDVAAAAGGALTAYQQRFEVDARDGMLILEFQPTKGEAIVSAIEVQ